MELCAASSPGAASALPRQLTLRAPPALPSPPSIAQAERRSLLERVQRVSGDHAEAAARVERLSMENDALSGELQASQEVCREMLAARRAARDALADMQAQNARLLAAYCERKGEAARLKEALRAAHREHEVRRLPWLKRAGGRGCWVALGGLARPAGKLLTSVPAALLLLLPQARVGVLKAQLRAAQGGSRAEGAVGQLRSPPPSPAATAGGASPATAAQPGASPAASASSAEEDLRAEASAQSAYSDPAAEYSGRGQPPQPADKENVGGNGSSSSRPRQAAKAPWDDERSELLSLLERLQGQLSVHAEQQASGATPRKQQQQQRPKQQRQAAADGSRAPATSPFASQPPEQERQRGSSPSGARPGSRAAANLEPSFESTVSGSGGSGSGSPAGSSRSAESDGGSPAVAAHHFSADSPLPPLPLPADSPLPPVTDGSPLPPHSCARSGAPSPPSVRPMRRPVSAEQPPGASPQSSAGVGGSPSKQQKQHVQRGASATMEAFLSPPVQCDSPAPASAGAQPSRDEQQRLQQAERRAAELEVSELWACCRQAAHVKRWGHACMCLLLPGPPPRLQILPALLHSPSPPGRARAPARGGGGGRGTGAARGAAPLHRGRKGRRQRRLPGAAV